MHAASPYVLDCKDPAAGARRSGVNGTGTSSRRASGHGSRVVLTSSMAAVTDEPEAVACSPRPTGTQSTLDAESVLLLEDARRARRLGVRASSGSRPSISIVINPFLVIGPSLVPGLNTSNQIFVDMLKGTYPGIVSLTWGFVDVRDVAAAHVRAMDAPRRKGRYICAGETVSMRAVVGILSETAATRLQAAGARLETGRHVIVRLSSYIQPKGVGSYLRTHLGRVPRYDTSKIRRNWGCRSDPREETIAETMTDLARWGHLPARRS